MTEEQAKALIECLEITIHAQMNDPYVMHEDKVAMLDSLHRAKVSFGIETTPEPEPA